MKKIALLIIIITVAAASAFSADSNQERFAEGVGHYNNGEFSAAVEIWMDLFNSGVDNYELMYNIGNAWFKQNEIPQAILFYERAALRKAGDEDVKYNLQVARSFIKDKYDAIPEVFLVNWFNLAALSISSDSWALLSVVSFIIMLLTALLFLFSSSYKTKVTSFVFIFILFLLSAVSLIFSFRSRHLVYHNEHAIITAPVLTGRSSPSDSGTSLFVIHEGLKVKTGEMIGGWCEIRLPDGNKGWVQTDAFEKI